MTLHFALAFAFFGCNVMLRSIYTGLRIIAQWP